LTSFVVSCCSSPPIVMFCLAFIVNVCVACRVVRDPDACLHGSKCSIQGEKARQLRCGASSQNHTTGGLVLSVSALRCPRFLFIGPRVALSPFSGFFIVCFPRILTTKASERKYSSVEELSSLPAESSCFSMLEQSAPDSPHPFLLV
jgi:hypothetical protein